MLTGDYPFKSGGNDDEFFLLCYMVGRLGNRDKVKKTSWYKRADKEMQSNMTRVIKEQQSENLIINDERLPKDERIILIKIFDWEPENRPSVEELLKS